MRWDANHPVYTAVAGFALIGIGLCLARYAYSPLIPPLIDEGWVSKAGAGYLGGFNSLGYLLGCGAGLWMTRFVSIRSLLRVSLLCTTVGLGMCAWNGGFGWLAVGRALAGFGGAPLVIHTPAVVLQQIPEAWKKISNGIVFSGAGSSIALVSLLLPIFLFAGVMGGWLFEAGLALIASIVAWPLTRRAPGTASRAHAESIALESETRRPLSFLACAYPLAAIAITPHMLFLSDYLHRDLGTTVALSSQLFALVGAGSLAGAATSGLIARLASTAYALLINYALGVAAIAMVLLSTSITVVSASAFLIGFFLMQCVALTSLRTGEIVGSARHPKWWGLLTLGFGLGLVVGSYGLSWLLALGLDYIDTFRVAQGVMVLAFVLFACSGLRAARHTSK